MNTQQPEILLSDGNLIPQLGLGVWQASDEQARASVYHALQSGYRHIDTASIYKNEQGVGLGITDAGISRDALFVTTKIWNGDQGLAKTSAALDASLQRLKLDYVDLLLIHWPTPKNGLFIETWQAMIDAKKQGKVRSIGVSNFNPEHLSAIIEQTGEKPVLNQIELHPLFQRQSLRQFHADHDIQTEAWSPLGQGKALTDQTLMSIGEKYQKSAAQIIIRWHLQLGNIVIPKSVTPSRIEENFNVFDFQLDESDMSTIASLDQNLRIGPDPETFYMA
ncbi:MAG: putative oxidoreductase/MSMEI_2347 [Candidatus Celerinatantimonas neptuna]|nr:MAG: putative oxidoreductase/MSMEI_2347 [Candidatus Celerinatantimonas neptuna]